jgi:twitching motility protein PilT
MDIFTLIHEARARDASDLHLVAASPPLLRIQGLLRQFNGATPLAAESVKEAFDQITTTEEREIFQKQLELDFGYSLPGVGRLRCNAAQQRGAISLAVRLLPPRIPTIDQLELPKIYKDLSVKPRGLLVVTGPTGSGKSTSIAAMIHHLNTTQSRHIVTIEDPIEYVHSSIKCAITQRQLGSDTLSFSHALKHVLRQTPDVIMVGEMRDLDTAAAVLTIAETGHLVLTTGHAPSTSQSIERVIDLFPPTERHLAQTRLASLLIGVICQTLVPRANSDGRIAACEIMMANPPVRNLIREGKIYQLPNVIRTHRDIGMMTMDQSLVNLYHDNFITIDTVFAICADPDEVKKILDSGIKRKGSKRPH